jgi:hypothetical protein
MPRKTIIAVLAVLLGAVAPASASAPAEESVCPPGITDATYCAAGNVSGLILLRHSAKTSDNRFVDVIVRCKSSSRCIGKLYLESSGGKIYGKGHYSIANGKHATVHVKLTAAGRHALGKTGKLKVTVAAVSNGVRSVIGHLKIKGQKVTAHHKHGRR